MAIDAVHLNGAMTGVQDYTNMKHHEESKVFLDQSHIMNEVNKGADDKSRQVINKDNSSKADNHTDARDGGNGTYAGDGGMFRKKKSEPPADGKVIPKHSSGFDMKI